MLANDFAPANLGVALAIDTTLYASEVFHVARNDGVLGWNRPVLILVPLRLGLNGVNPIYYSSLQHYFTLPQCVGIAGGRPSSSYYFVGVQGNQLFYIDPHHTKPSVKAVNVPANLQELAQQDPLTDAKANSSTPSLRDNASRSQLDQFFASAYSPKDLESFHCEKVRKMSLSALDPSMLVGLLCQSKQDWEDLCRRMKEFPASKDHHAIINIVQEMPAWMRKSSRTISGAGLNASTSSQKPSGKPGPARGGVSSTTSPKGSVGVLSGDDFEGSSIDYADSDDWDIDDSDDEDNNARSEGSELEESNGGASIVIKSPPSSFQEIVPGSFESDEPDYAASRSARLPATTKQDVASDSMTKRQTTGEPTSLDDDFERMSIVTATREISSSPSEGDAVVVLPVPAKSPPTAKQTTIRSEGEEGETDAGWQELNGRSV